VEASTDYVNMSIGDFNSNVNNLISRNMEAINELDAVIQSLLYIHSEISKVRSYITLYSNNIFIL